MKKQDPIDPTGGQVVNIADARVRRQKPKAPKQTPDPFAGTSTVTVNLPDLSDVTNLFDMAFGLMSAGDPGLKQLRKGLRKPPGKKEVVVIRKAVNGLLKHLGPEDTERTIDKAIEILNEARSALPAKP